MFSGNDDLTKILTKNAGSGISVGFSKKHETNNLIEGVLYNTTSKSIYGFRMDFEGNVISAVKGELTLVQ